MSYEKPVVRDYGDVAEVTAAQIGVDDVCNSVDVCIGGAKDTDVL
ncbi:MAG: lasso RiPP family leader peptide-containing protein [Egibacteraceae bacterium]